MAADDQIDTEAAVADGTVCVGGMSGLIRAAGDAIIGADRWRWTFSIADRPAA